MSWLGGEAFVVYVLGPSDCLSRWVGRGECNTRGIEIYVRVLCYLLSRAHYVLGESLGDSLSAP